MRMGERSKISMIRVPFAEPLSTIRPEPSARCRALSDRFHGRPSCESSGLGSSMKSDGDVGSNIGFHQLVIAAARPLARGLTSGSIFPRSHRTAIQSSERDRLARSPPRVTRIRIPPSPAGRCREFSRWRPRSANRPAERRSPPVSKHSRRSGRGRRHPA
jgi:hypothetical protein